MGMKVWPRAMVEVTNATANTESRREDTRTEEPGSIPKRSASVGLIST
jgi:hypothetical protein